MESHHITGNKSGKPVSQFSPLPDELLCSTGTQHFFFFFPPHPPPQADRQNRRKFKPYTILKIGGKKKKLLGGWITLAV